MSMMHIRVEVFCVNIYLYNYMLHLHELIYYDTEDLIREGFNQNKLKMAYSLDLPKMARQQCGIMD